MLRVSIIDQMNKRRKRAHFDQRRRMRVDLNPDSCPSERASDGIDRTAWMRMHHGARQFAEACGDMRQYAAARGILRRRATVCGEACDRMEHSKPFTRGRAGRFTHPGPPPPPHALICSAEAAAAADARVIPARSTIAWTSFTYLPPTANASAVVPSTFLTSKSAPRASSADAISTPRDRWASKGGMMIAITRFYPLSI